MELDNLIKRLMNDIGKKYELSDSSSDKCWKKISEGISQRRKLTFKIKRKLYRINKTIPVKTIGFAAAVIAICIVVPFGINRCKNSMNQYKNNVGLKVNIKKDNPQSELEKKLYSIVDEVARSKFKKYSIESYNPYILNNDYDYQFRIYEVTDENRIPGEIKCVINKDNFKVETEVLDFSKHYENVEDLINILEGYNNDSTVLAYDIPEQNTNDINYYVHQNSPSDSNKVFYAYHYDNHTLYRKDNNTGKYNAIYQYKLNSNGPMVKHLSCDLDGDGINEQISFDIVSHILTVNNMKMCYCCYSNVYKEGYNDVLYTVDINKSDNTKEIVLRELNPSLAVSHIFSYKNGNINICGSISSWDITLNGNNSILAKNIVNGCFETLIRDEEYELDENYHIKNISKDFYSVDDYNFDDYGNKEIGRMLTVKKEIPIMKDKNSNEIAVTLKIGEKVKFLGIYRNQWVLLQNSQGVKGWIEVKGTIIKRLNTFSGNVFEGLFFAN